ncbi:hypothetical protein Y032_0013g1991 [Ancylostoma ceylanicum]|uniref:Uncharacterized protein n=1 Tax=Ancylostoma ceylanicum TaxID=53326 RepID=A0A016VB08_9BILA|nr:hypothetical protein Y032_0013g1991 [Ancylostoma ceylanicum]
MTVVISAARSNLYLARKMAIYTVNTLFTVSMVSDTATANTFTTPCGSLKCRCRNLSIAVSVRLRSKW